MPRFVGMFLFLATSIVSRGQLNYTLSYKDNYLKEQSKGKKSIKDVLRWLYNWSKENKRAFTMEEFPTLINKACGIDLTGIYRKWQLPVE